MSNYKQDLKFIKNYIEKTNKLFIDIDNLLDNNDKDNLQLFIQKCDCKISDLKYLKTTPLFVSFDSELSFLDSKTKFYKQKLEQLKN